MIQIIAALLFLFCAIVKPPLAAQEWDKKIYLATYPRSGNHWMRYLIEEVTNVATSSAYHDTDTPMHLLTPFPWGFAPQNGYEGIRRYPEKDDVYIMKTHFPCFEASRFEQRSSLKTIRVIRHPVDSFYSFYAYMYLGRPPSRQVPKEKLDYFIATWRRFQGYWNLQPNVLTIRYEDLYNFPEETLTKVIEFIGFNDSQNDIQRAVKRYPPTGGIMKYFSKFPKDDLQRISYELQDLMNKYNY